MSSKYILYTILNGRVKEPRFSWINLSHKLKQNLHKPFNKKINSDIYKEVYGCLEKTSIV